jgi:large subunit ribosomal protein L17
MRHRKLKGKLSVSPSHRKALLRNLLLNLLKYERIQTTVAKAKQLKRYADPIIELGKRTDLNAKRLVRKTVQQKDAFQKLFNVYGPRFKSRQGGYTRIYRLGTRHGDGAALSLIEILPDPSKENEPRIVKTRKAKTEEEEGQQQQAQAQDKKARKAARKKAKKSKDVAHSSSARKSDKGTGRAKTTKKGLS